MATTTDKMQLTTLLSNDLLARVERLRLNTRRRLTNRSRGEHRSRAAGSSVEFRDYRDYSPGDDTRFVDWNIFARLHRPYVRLYHDEEQMHLAVLIDASASMDFDGKLLRAKQVAAAIGAMGLLATERVSVHAFDGRDASTRRMPPKRGRASMRELFAFIESIEPGGDAPIERGVEAMLRTHRGRGVCLIVSDFMTDGDLNTPLNRLFGAGLEIFAVQVLSPAELDPPLTSDHRLVDSETDATVDVSAGGDLLAVYRDHLNTHLALLGLLCRQRGGRLLTIASDEPIEHVLLDTLRRRGWVR